MNPGVRPGHQNSQWTVCLWEFSASLESVTIALITTLIKNFKRLQSAKGQIQGDMGHGARVSLRGGITDLCALSALQYITGVLFWPLP